MTGTIFENIYSKEPHYVPIDDLLERIRVGRSKTKVTEIQATIDKEKADMLKKQLPAVCFSGKFKAERKDDDLIEHSGFEILDFDDVDVDVLMIDIQSKPFIYAAWLSPRGNGIKALAKIADKTKHREHFAAIRELWTKVGEDGKIKRDKNGEVESLVDKSGVNPSRVCFESYDPHIYINKNAVPFTTIKIVEKVENKTVVSDTQEKFKNIVQWLSNKNEAFVTGERNSFIYKLASACCRFGIDREDAESMILNQFQTSNDFTDKEATATIRSAYRSRSNDFGSAAFERDQLVNKVTRKELDANLDVYNPDIKPRDVVYGIDVKDRAMDIFNKGYEFVQGVGIKEFDTLFKMRKGEITLLTGIGNYGKSALKKWYQVVRAVLFGEKFASFPPEDYPIQSYYHELTEILLGCDCTPSNSFRPSLKTYNAAYDFISSHFFYIYPTDLSPTPDYIKERFLELIIKEGVDGCDIDPFNQMTNEYGKHGGRSDKYLETVLSDFLRFAQINNVYFWIIAHPIKMQKAQDQNYPCPDVFDIADGAMWNNKMNNILVYHRPVAQTDPMNPLCQFYTKKIKDQKTVGEKGSIDFEFKRSARRFVFDGTDPLDKILKEKKITF